MADQIYIGNFAKGLKTDRLPFNIDNDAFPMMYNMYSWRGRAKKKRGTKFLAQLERQIANLTLASITRSPGINTDNIFTLLGLSSSQPGAAVVPGSASNPLVIQFAGTVMTDNTGTGTFTLNTTAFISNASINYSTGVITYTVVSGFSGNVIVTSMDYYPGLPVLGLEDFVQNNSNTQFPVLLAFDTTYSYQIKDSVSPPFFYSTSYYKTTQNPVVWSNQDYAQFWSENYQSAFWVTNNKPGFHFLNGTYISGSETNTITFNFKSGGVNFTTLVANDVLWFNEWPSPSTINGNMNINTNGKVLVNLGGGNYTVQFSTTVVVAGTGIAQMLTNSIPGQDGIRWYDGDPTNGTGLPSASLFGWVNFAPPLTATNVGINDQAPALYYLVGALAIVAFKDRLLFCGPQIQTSSGPVIQQPIQDTILWSWNGTPYYNSLVPTTPTGTETFDARAYWQDQTGFGGNLPAGISQPITTLLNNEDVLLVGFGGKGHKTRFVYTGNDIQPFLFYLINSELPSASTFSGVVLDKGGVEIGQYGLTITSQQSSERIDLDIPDEVFNIQTLNNGYNRVNAIRDFYREWMYFSFPTGNGNAGQESWVYPNQSLLFNYRDNTWAILRENFTHHGSYRASSGFTWATCPFLTWSVWNEPWNSASSQAEFPSIIAGNPQGYVLIKDAEGTNEGISGTVQTIANDGFGNTQITSINHCVNSQSPLNGLGGDYLYFSNAIGSTSINGNIGLVINVIDKNNFVVDINFASISGTYFGAGNYTRLIQPLIQTKQLATYWEQGRKIRLCAQKYLMETTQAGQVSVNIYLSQDPNTIYNEGNLVPGMNVVNNTLIYSQLMYTCPESTNLGLTPANVNLQMPTAANQFEIWHRLNTSLIGDSVQIGITLNDIQMRNINYATAEITLHAIQLTVERASILS